LEEEVQAAGGAVEVEDLFGAVERELEEKRRLIEEAIQELLADEDVSALPDVARYILAGGKRFRGSLTLIVAEALGGGREQALPAAVAIELVQAATLALDDIIDGDEVRRGRLAAWLKYGLSRSVMASLLLIPLAQKLVENLGFKALYHVIRAWEATVRGEVLDSFFNERVPPDRYLEICKLKTGSLFRLATILGALAAKADDETVEQLARYGDLLGIIYQLADDITDYTLHTTGKGKPLEPGLQIFIKWAKNQGAETPEEITAAALAYLRDRIQEAQEIIQNLQADPAKKQILHAIPHYIAHRMLAEANLQHLL